MDVKTYHIAVQGCDDRNNQGYTEIDDRVKILEESVSKSKTMFHDSFDTTTYIDKIKTTAKIDKGTIKMPDYGKTKVSYDFDDFYEVNFEESYDIDIYREKIVIAENCNKGYLVTKWQDIPLSNEIDVSIISDIASRTIANQLYTIPRNLVYLYSDNYDEYNYIIQIEHTRTNENILTPKVVIEKRDDKGLIVHRTESYPFGQNINNSDKEFLPVSGLSISRNYDGSLSLGMILRDTKAIYGYGNRGVTSFNHVGDVNLLSLYARVSYYGSSSWSKNTDSINSFNTHTSNSGNCSVLCYLTIESDCSVSNITTRLVSSHIQLIYDGYISNNVYGSTSHVGVDMYGLPHSIKTIRDGVVTSCESFPKANYGVSKSAGSSSKVFNDNAWGDNFSFKNHIISNCKNFSYESDLFNFNELKDVNNCKDTYTFAHDGVVYSLLTGYNSKVIDYKSILKTPTDNYIFDKKFELKKPYCTRKQTISAFKYMKVGGKLLSVVGEDVTDNNNIVHLEYHDIDPISRTIATSGDEKNISSTIDFLDRYNIELSTHFTDYGHTGSYFAMHEDHKNGLLHLVFPGRRAGESTSICRLYHMNLDLKTLKPIGSPGQITMTTTTQSDFYNYQNVSICNRGNEVLVSCMFSDGRDHADTYVYSLEKHSATVEVRVQTDKGDDIRLDSENQSFTFNHLISQIRFVATLDNQVGVSHSESTNIDHIEFAHNGSKDQNKEFVFESENLPLNLDEGRVTFYIEFDEKDGKIDWFLSFDNGNTWEPYVPESQHRFNSYYRTVKLKAVLSVGDSEYNEKFKSPFIRRYVLKVDGGVLQNDIVKLQINLAKTNFKLDSFTNSTRNGLNKMLIDVFNDESNIDIAKSDYIFDEANKLVKGKHIVTKPEKITSTMTNMLLVVDELDTSISSSIKYFVSRDGGRNFIRIFPNTVTNIPIDAANNAITDTLVFKAEFEGDSKLTAWSWSWD